MTTTPPRPPHRDPRFLALVAVGGALGSAARAALAHAHPTPPGGWPGATLTVNLAGALLLGLLLGVLARSGMGRGRRRGVRLALGTGVLGGFTTYSTLAVEAALLARAGAWSTAGAYGAGSVLCGVAAAWLGFAGARLLARVSPVPRAGTRGGSGGPGAES